MTGVNAADLCANCSGEIADSAYLCDRCTDKLERDLGQADAAAAELVTTRLRQSRTGNVGVGVASRSYERPLEWDEKAAEIADALTATLLGWVKVVVEERGVEWPK